MFRRLSSTPPLRTTRSGGRYGTNNSVGFEVKSSKRAKGNEDYGISHNQLVYIHLGKMKFLMRMIKLKLSSISLTASDYKKLHSLKRNMSRTSKST